MISARGSVLGPPKPRRRVGYHALVLTIGLVVGGTLQTIARQFLPPGPAKVFLTAGLAPYLEPQSINLILLKFTVGPLAIDVSLVSLLGVLLAYLIARSLF